MFDSQSLDARRLNEMAEALSGLDVAVSDAERIDRVRALEQLKSAAAAAQAKVTAEFAASQRQAQAAAGVRVKDLGTGIAAQVGLAKRESPARARRYVGWAGVLVAELPHTFAALRRGEATEWRAMIVARETGWLSRQHRAVVDAEVGPRLQRWGDRQVEAEVKKAAYRLDPHGYLARTRGAEADRRVSIRPAPDTMARLSGFVPVAQGVAAYASLQQHADTLISRGDPRSRGQIMADTLVERLTGQPTADAVPAQINLIMTDQTLFNRRTHHDDHHHEHHHEHHDDHHHDHHRERDGSERGARDGRERGARGRGSGADEPAHLDGYGPIPADLARRLVADAPKDAQVWLRRLYTRPDTGALVAMESRSRFFEHGLRRFLAVRDQTCRTQWCDAPVRHLDHVVPVEDGGKTSAENGQGYCEACNYAKQAPGWQARPGPGGAGHSVVATTPTGHTYTSRPPDPPGAPPPVGSSHLESLLRDLILAA